MKAPHGNPSPEEVRHRIRNRLIQYLESLVRYEEEPPPWDLNEQLEQWQDWVPWQRPFSYEDLPDPIYSSYERSALLIVDSAWNALCDATPSPIHDDAAALRMAEWAAFHQAASHALRTMMVRGPFYDKEGP